MKNFAGSCVEADSSGSNMDANASYMRKRNVPACQQVFIDNITTSASYLGNDPEYTKLTNESLQSGYIYDYISKNSDSMENMCKKIRYPNASITHADESPVRDQITMQPSVNGNHHLLQMYKTGADLTIRGFLEKTEFYGPFNINEPAYYYNNIFPPYCNSII